MISMASKIIKQTHKSLTPVFVHIFIISLEFYWGLFVHEVKREVWKKDYTIITLVVITHCRTTLIVTLHSTFSWKASTLSFWCNLYKAQCNMDDSFCLFYNPDCFLNNFIFVSEVLYYRQELCVASVHWYFTGILMWNIKFNICLYCFMT